MMNDRELRAKKRAIYGSIKDVDPDELLKVIMPLFAPYRHLFEGTGLGQLMDRWDPVLQEVMDCPVCSCFMLDHATTCPFQVEPDPDLDGLE